MHKKLVILFLAFVIMSASASAMAIGGAFSLDPIGNGAYGTALSLKLDSFEPLLGISARASGGTFNLGVTADWWMDHAPLAGILSLYVGPGGYLSLALGDNTNINIGARLPVGLQIFPIDPLELFLEVAPAIGISLSPLSFPIFDFQGAIGFRFWF